MPVTVTATDSVFELTENTDIYVPQHSEEVQKIGQYLADKLNPSTGLGLEVKPVSYTHLDVYKRQATRRPYPLC